MTILLGFPLAIQVIELPLGLEDFLLPEMPMGMQDQF
jgi:hypothetical protein